MSKHRFSNILLLLVSTHIFLVSCVIDTIPLGYRVKNCTKDTMLIELTVSDTLEGIMVCGKNPYDTLHIDSPEDTTVVYIHGKKVIYSNYFYTLPDSESGAIFPDQLYKDPCYIYAINWQVATHYSMDEIRKKKLYDCRKIRRSDFHRRVYEYKTQENAGKR